jgi:hypothetical protein
LWDFLRLSITTLTLSDADKLKHAWKRADNCDWTCADDTIFVSVCGFQSCSHVSFSL